MRLRHVTLTLATGLVVLLAPAPGRAQDEAGSIVGWGSQVFGADLSEGFVAIAAGCSHSLGLKADGSIVAWGENNDGECDVPAPNTDFVGIAAGYSHNLGLKSNGSIVGWGANAAGQCDAPAPTTGFAVIAAGVFHSLGLRACIVGDVDCDGDVDLADLAGLLGAYGTCDGNPFYNPDADFDDSGCVDLSELATLLGHYGFGDCNGNGVLDWDDITAGTSADCNGNWIPDECECPGDLDYDNDVDLADLAQLLGGYGTTSGAAYEDGDLDCDGDVNLADLAGLLGAYGTTC